MIYHTSVPLSFEEFFLELSWTKRLLIVSKHDCRSELQKLLGYAVSDGNLQKVVQLARRLCGFQPRNNAASQKLDENLTDTDVEFGSNLNFRPPSRFLVDISLEDEENLYPEDLAPSTSLYSNWPAAADAADKHVSNNRIRYDLKWLRESCDLIVQGSGSQLTRDELAMTICRVLDSDKPGEEVFLEFESVGISS